MYCSIIQHCCYTKTAVLKCKQTSVSAFFHAFLYSLNSNKKRRVLWNGVFCCHRNEVFLIKYQQLFNFIKVQSRIHRVNRQSRAGWHVRTFIQYKRDFRLNLPCTYYSWTFAECAINVLKVKNRNWHNLRFYRDPKLHFGLHRYTTNLASLDWQKFPP